jgi:RIO kinase 2
MALSAENIRDLHRYEKQILNILEQGMRRYRWVPLEEIRHATGLSESEVDYRLGRLMKWGMVRFDAVPYDGYNLVADGYDSLALMTLVRRGTIRALGCQIGLGKESVLYSAMGLGTVALKLHHVGQRSFQAVREKRGYTADEGHSSWIFASRVSAEREYDALKRLSPAVRVPLPIDQNRHVVVMEYIEGRTLNRCTLEDPEGSLGFLISQIREAYQRGVIHSDLSEFNVMVESDGGMVLIDWPQWVGPSHENASTLLENDISNILAYFRRKYRIDEDPREVLTCITR